MPGWTVWRRCSTPKRWCRPEVKYFDLPGLGSVAQTRGITGQQRNLLQTADAFLLVVQAFSNPAVVHPLGDSNPQRDLETMLGELIFSDLEILERAVGRLEDWHQKGQGGRKTGGHDPSTGGLW